MDWPFKELVMTEQEKQVVLKLAEAWDMFNKLPTEHTMDRMEFCMNIHACQEKVMARQARREMNKKGD